MPAIEGAEALTVGIGSGAAAIAFILWLQKCSRPSRPSRQRSNGARYGGAPVDIDEKYDDDGDRDDGDDDGGGDDDGADEGYTDDGGADDSSGGADNWGDCGADGDGSHGTAMAIDPDPEAFQHAARVRAGAWAGDATGAVRGSADDSFQL